MAETDCHAGTSTASWSLSTATASRTSYSSATACSWDGPHMPLTFVVFDVLRVEGRDVTNLPYSERRIILEELDLNGRYWKTPEAFDDGGALWEAVCEHELEGVVAKRRSDKYLVPGGRGWIKTKNRDYWRYEIEREGAFASRRPRRSSGSRILRRRRESTCGTGFVPSKRSGSRT